MNKQEIQTLWDESLNAFGTAEILQKRISTLKKKSNLSKFLNIGNFIILGGSVTTLGFDNSNLKNVIFVVGISSTLSALVSVVALVNTWEDKIKEYSESIIKNTEISEELKEYAKRFNSTNKNTMIEMSSKVKNQKQNDSKFNFSPKEKRYGMRYGLFQFGRKCFGCNEIPNLKEPSKICNVCGK